MNRKWVLSLSVLLAAGTVLAACQDDRPGRHRPPRHDNDRPNRPGDGRPDRPGNDWGNSRPDRPR